ncbi:deoxynucleoside kinase [Caldibacillus lycopersici]|uniref:Deoxynucleoside kinase n=1 Tax=Perspicuibacillus lycopersici TaxID=1325689 RepID=A0AAE3LS36_9BACI|nr:deoxynucleoside kinase [Perspicuibacillus lycopersici]MCU9615354.1 deoxynucleoside kinase [Perspicuibacillus lycopersici]
MNTHFIAVEGPIGVGKSSLAKAISEHFQYHLLNEIVGENPFLSKFYDNIDEWSFQTEMFFLCNRFKQLEDIQNDYLQKSRPVVADYHMFKNLIFAHRTLKTEHYHKYHQIFHLLTNDLPQPNIVIYLHANLDTLFKRISKRGRAFEKNISPMYLENLCSDYENYLANFEKEHPNTPVLRLNGDEIDFVENKDDLKNIFTQIENLLFKGVITE